MYFLIALAKKWRLLHAACIGQRDVTRLAWVLLTVGGTHGRSLRLGRYREFVVDHGMCQACLFTSTQIFCRPSNSLCDHSMRTGENQKAPISFCANNSVESFGISGWLLIRSCSILAFSRTTSLVELMSPFPVLQQAMYRRVSLMSRVSRRSSFILRSWCNLDLKILVPRSRTRDFTVDSQYNYRYAAKALYQAWYKAFAA